MRREVWYPGDTANFSIGQGDLLVTPLQIARIVAAITNSGVLIQPHILKRIGDRDAANIKTENLRISKENINALKFGMRLGVEDPDGTGARAFSNKVSISAKTGTVQVGPGIIPHGWFVGFAPSEGPGICFAVFMENCGTGGDAPAEIAKQAVEYWFRNER